MSKTLIIPDVHLGKGLTIGKSAVGSALNSRIVDQKKLLDWIVDVTQERDVDRIILTGDIFEDVKPDYILLKILIEWLQVLDAENIEVHIIVGNHDMKRTGGIYTSVLDIVDIYDFHHVHIHKNINTIIADNVGFTLMPYRDRRALNVDSNAEALKIIEDKVYYEQISIPSIYDKVLIGHFCLEGAIYMDEVDDLLNELVCPLSMFTGYDYVWMGHVHKPQVFNKKPYIAHIGSLDLSDFGETGHQKIIVLFDSESENKFENINVPSRPLRKMKFTVKENENSNDFILNKIKEFHENYSLNNALVKLDVIIEGKDTIGLNKSAIEKVIYDYGAFHIPYFSEIRNIEVVSSEKKDLVDNTVDAKSAVKLYANTITFDSEDEQNEFVAKAIEIIEEYHSSTKEK